MLTRYRNMWIARCGTIRVEGRTRDLALLALAVARMENTANNQK